MSSTTSSRTSAYVHYFLVRTYYPYQEPILDGTRYYRSSDEFSQWNIRLDFLNRTHQGSNQLFCSKKRGR